MKQVVIEIDGVRHRLVPDTEIPKAECMRCSMQQYCYTCDEIVSGLCCVFDQEDCHFEKEVTK